MNARVPMKRVERKDGSIEEVVDWTKINTPIAFDGKKITLPSDPTEMPISDAVDFLKRYEEQENQKFDVHEIVKGAPWDTLYSTYLALQEI